jgi:hypothetical protein
MAARTITAIPGSEWAALFTDFKQSAFRLEARQHYTAPDEQDEFGRFLAGEEPRPELTWWTELTRGHVAAGRTMSRVRVIVEPPSDYTRFELAAFPIMAAAGDDIRIISVSPRSWPPAVPHEDFWIFDDKHLWILHYDETGFLHSAELVNDPQVVAAHLRWRDAALELSVPVNDYLATRTRKAS